MIPIVIESRKNKLDSLIEMEEQKGKVCVTGGTGFIGSWLIMRLLDHGYFVTTTVRSDPGMYAFKFRVL